MVAEVILPGGPPRSFSYLVREDVTDAVKIGCRVIVPFRSRNVIGVVWSLSHKEEVARELKRVVDVIDDRPVLEAEHISFATWLSRYYHCPISATLKLMLSRSLMTTDKLTVRKLESVVELKPDLQYLADKLRVGKRTRVKDLFGAADQTQGLLRSLDSLDRAGAISLGSGISRTSRYANKKVELATHVREAPGLGSRQKEVLTLLQSRSSSIRVESVISRLGVSYSTIDSLLRRKLIRWSGSRESRKTPLTQELLLNTEQAAVSAELCRAVRQEEFSTYLLHGVTGSGKTEVYVRIIWDTIELGKSAILLQPEIAMSEQLYLKLADRFGSMIGRVHSGLSDSDRFAIYRGLITGRIRVIIGPRSALLCPIRSLGLIVVDEEHDPSYKQSGTAPFYQGRDSAVVLGRFWNCPVVLGTATPSLESWQNAKSGKYKLVNLPARWDERELPYVKTVQHTPTAEASDILSPYLKCRLHACVEEGAQAVLFLNRRGFAPTVKCRQCRKTIMCPNCDVGLVFHKKSERLRCHLCGVNISVPQSCPECNSDKLGFFGAGTQKIEDVMAEQLTGARIGRLDVDSAVSAQKAARILKLFEQHKYDVLVGTQMVAKGLDFPNVKLVGILSADAALSLPDFRAAERVYSLVHQASGRAGRARYKGEVVIQVDDAETPLLNVKDESDYLEFLDKEMERRKALGYPPFKRLILVKLKSVSPKLVESAAHEVQKALSGLRDSYSKYMTVLGPAPAPIFRIKNNYRWRLLIKTQSVSSSLGVIESVMNLKRVRSELRKTVITVDVDPYDML